MPDTRQHTHLPFENLAVARLLVEITHPETGNKGWYELGPAEDVKLTLSRETQAVEDRLHGIDYEVGSRLRGVKAVLTGKLIENCNPDVTKYLFGQGSTQTHRAAIMEVTRESFRLWGEDKYILPHAAGIAASVAGPDLSASSATYGTGSSIPEGTNSYAVVAWADEDETVGSFPELENEDWMHFTIAASPNSENVALVWAAPSGFTPHHYSVYAQAAATFNPANAAIKLLETTSLSCVISSHTSIGLKTFGAAAPATYSLVDEAGVEFDVNTDYLFDTATGEVSAVSTGEITNGELVMLTFARLRPAEVETPIGAGVARPTFAKLRVMQLEEGEDGYETGCEATIYKVNMQSGDSPLTFPKEPGEGMDFSWDCLLDRTYNKIGIKVDRDPALETFTLQT